MSCASRYSLLLFPKKGKLSLSAIPIVFVGKNLPFTSLLHSNRGKEETLDDNIVFFLLLLSSPYLLRGSMRVLRCHIAASSAIPKMIHSAIFIHPFSVIQT